MSNFIEIENDLKVNKNMIEMVTLIPDYVEDNIVFEVYIFMKRENTPRKKTFNLEIEARAFYNQF